jgi:hypothetical protein
MKTRKKPTKLKQQQIRSKAARACILAVYDSGHQKF